MRIARHIQPIPPVGPDTVGAVVFERFQAEPNLMVIPVVDVDERPQGLIERNAFMLKMAAAFGRELYAGRPVSGLMNARPVIAESPVAIECRVTEVKELGSHHMFLAEVTGVSVDEQWLNERGSLELAKAEPIVYSHGGYYGLSELLGTFGWSVKKKKRCQR